MINKVKKQKIRTFDNQNTIWIHLMPVAGFALLILFAYLPLPGIIIAFQDYNVLDGYLGSHWVGFEHFKRLISDPYFWRLFRNTFIIGFSSYLITFFPPIIFAIILDELYFTRFKKVIQNVAIFPYFIPMVVMVGIMFLFFGSYGIVNQLITSLGGDTINFMTSKDSFLPMYIGSAVWKGMGWGSVIYMGTLSNINVEMKEAANIDGATRWQRIRHITLPALRPIIITMFILDAGGIMSVGFEKIHLMYSPGTYEVADVFSTYVYRQGIQDGNYSYSTAVGLFNNLLSTSMVLLTNWIAQRAGEEGIM